MREQVHQKGCGLVVATNYEYSPIGRLHGKSVRMAKKAHGQVAIASAKKAYQIYQGFLSHRVSIHLLRKAPLPSGCFKPAPVLKIPTPAT